MDRLSELREQLEQRLEKLETPDQVAGLELSEEEKYLEKLENGGMSLQFSDYVACWICMEDDAVSFHYILFLYLSIDVFVIPESLTSLKGDF